MKDRALAFGQLIGLLLKLGILLASLALVGFALYLLWGLAWAVLS